MADNGDFPTIIGADARFKGELSFDRGVRIDGAFDGHIKSKGSLHVAEGAKVAANIEASNVRVEGDCRGNFVVSEKLHLMATAKVEGDLRTTRLEIADGAIFSGNVVVGQTAMEAPVRRTASEVSINPSPDVARMPTHPSAAAPAPAPRPVPRPQEIRIPAAS